MGCSGSFRGTISVLQCSTLYDRMGGMETTNPFKIGQRVRNIDDGDTGVIEDIWPGRDGRTRFDVRWDFESRNPWAHEAHELASFEP